LTPTWSKCSFKEAGVDSLHFNVQFFLMIGRRVKSLIKLASSSGRFKARPRWLALNPPPHLNNPQLYYIEFNYLTIEFNCLSLSIGVSTNVFT
jgi:hypothetical protein